MDKKDAAKEWFAIAESDLSSAAFLQKTHDLVLLNKVCQKYEEDFKTIEDECLVLTDYSVNVRYPFPMDINESDMKIALRSAKKIKGYVLEKANPN